MRRVLLPILFIFGCSTVPPSGLAVGGGQEYARLGLIEDRWSVTMAACGDPEPWEVLEDEYRDPLRDNATCMRLLEDDIGMDLESMGGSEMHVSLLRATLIELMGADLGTLDDLDTLPSDVRVTARQPLVDALRAIGEATDRPETQAALYNLVTSLITRVEKVDSINDGEGHGSEIEVATGRLYTTGSCLYAVSSWVCLSVLVHEAAHVWNHDDHVLCPEGVEVEGRNVSGLVMCDDTWNSAYGFEGGAIALLDHHLPTGRAYEPRFREDANWILDKVDALVLKE